MLAEITAIAARGGLPLLPRKSSSLSGRGGILRQLQRPNSEATCPPARAAEAGHEPPSPNRAATQPRRGLDRDEAAIFVGVTLATFDQMVRRRQAA